MTMDKIKAFLDDLEVRDFPIDSAFLLEGDDRLAQLTVLMGKTEHPPCVFAPGDFADTAMLLSLVRLELQSAVLRELDDALHFRGTRLVAPGGGYDEAGFTHSLADRAGKS